MKCAYCGMETNEYDEYCPNCGVSADGYFLEQEIIDIKQVKKEIMNSKGLLGLHKAKDNLLQDRDNISYELAKHCPHCKKEIAEKEYYCTRCAEPIPILKSVRKKFKKPKTRKQIIKEQFRNDRTSICPRCGSHSVTVYRRGYDYVEAFWGEMFGLKGSRYTAGMNVNDAMCYCQHCKCFWNSKYDIRGLK